LTAICRRLDTPSPGAVNSAAEVVPPGEGVSKAMRERQYLSYRHVGQDAIDEMGGVFGHPPAAAASTPTR
jgi:hypothetical protein